MGSNFYCNANCIINAGKQIVFGDNALLGWNVTVIDGDGHTIIRENNDIPKYDDITIGDHVWLAAKSSVLKGSTVRKDSVVAYGAIVSKNMEQQNIIIGGQNRIIRTNIDWRR